MFFFFNDTATTEIYTLSLHDALPIFSRPGSPRDPTIHLLVYGRSLRSLSSFSTRSLRSLSSSLARDRKSTRLNSSHANISYAVFCLKKKKKYSHSHSEFI